MGTCEIARVILNSVRSPHLYFTDVREEYKAPSSAVGGGTGWTIRRLAFATSTRDSGAACCGLRGRGDIRYVSFYFGPLRRLLTISRPGKKFIRKVLTVVIGARLPRRRSRQTPLTISGSSNSSQRTGILPPHPFGSSTPQSWLTEAGTLGRPSGIYRRQVFGCKSVCNGLKPVVIDRRAVRGIDDAGCGWVEIKWSEWTPVC
jgi:hypothetical protein